MAAEVENDLDAVGELIHHRNIEVWGLPPRYNMLVRPGTQPKASSSKLQRSLCKLLYLTETLQLA